MESNLDMRSVISRRSLAIWPLVMGRPLLAADWATQALKDAAHDRSVIPYDGITPNRMVCDTTLRELPDRSWILFILAGGDTEPSPLNYIGVTRSRDRGKTWSTLERVDPGIPRVGKTVGQGATELVVRKGRCSLYFATHSHHWRNDWKSWVIHSSDSCRSWSKPEPLPGRLADRTFIRNHIVTRDGRILLPFQHYVGPESEAAKPPLERALTNPRNGVLMSADGGRTWTEHGNIRLTNDDRYFGQPRSHDHSRRQAGRRVVLRGVKRRRTDLAGVRRQE
jgi:hypothetical protein